MPINFDKHAQKGNEFINELALALGDKKERSKAGRILRAVFTALREHLSLEENFQFLSQLPAALKVVYIDGWMPTHHHENSRKKVDFILEVIKNEKTNSLGSVSEVHETEREIKIVFKTLKKYISLGEFKHLEAVLPHQLKELLHDSIYYKKLSIQLINDK